MGSVSGSESGESEEVGGLQVRRKTSSGWERATSYACMRVQTV